jgi:hypothetical protein
MMCCAVQSMYCAQVCAEVWCDVLLLCARERLSRSYEPCVSLGALCVLRRRVCDVAVCVMSRPSPSPPSPSPRIISAVVIFALNFALPFLRLDSGDGGSSHLHDGRAHRRLRHEVKAPEKRNWMPCNNHALLQRAEGGRHLLRPGL